MVSLKKKKKIKEQRKAILLVAFVIAVVVSGIVWVGIQNAQPACPECSQHYLFVDNSDTFSAIQLEKLGDGAGSGLISVIWADMEVGDELHVYALNPQTLDAERINDIEIIRITNLQDVNEFTAAPRRVKIELDKVFAELKKVLQDVNGASLAESRIFETLNRIAYRINNHHRTYGGGEHGFVNYSVTVYSDLIQNSDIYSFYDRGKSEFHEWNDSWVSGEGRLSFVEGANVTINLCKVPKNDIRQDKKLDKFWLEYVKNSGATLNGRPC